MHPPPLGRTGSLAGFLSSQLLVTSRQLNVRPHANKSAAWFRKGPRSGCELRPALTTVRLSFVSRWRLWERSGPWSSSGASFRKLWSLTTAVPLLISRLHRNFGSSRITVNGTVAGIPKPTGSKPSKTVSARCLVSTKWFQETGWASGVFSYLWSILPS